MTGVQTCALPISRLPPVVVVPLFQETVLTVGVPAHLRFRLIDPATKAVREGLKDVRVLTMLAPGVWQQRHSAMSVEIVTQRPDCDVLILGGGVNGTGVARDLALRGLRVTLVERNDLAFGASGNSSGMIHGGPRYMLSTPDVTRTSCLDSGFVQQIAPHLIFRIPFLMPVYGRDRRARILIDRKSTRLNSSHRL